MQFLLHDIPFSRCILFSNIDCFLLPDCMSPSSSRNFDSWLLLCNSTKQVFNTSYLFCPDGFFIMADTCDTISVATKHTMWLYFVVSFVFPLNFNCASTCTNPIDGSSKMAVLSRLLYWNVHTAKYCLYYPN